MSDAGKENNYSIIWRLVGNRKILGKEELTKLREIGGPEKYPTHKIMCNPGKQLWKEFPWNIRKSLEFGGNFIVTRKCFMDAISMNIRVMQLSP